MTSTPQPLYREPVQLNAQLHRHKKLRRFDDHSVLANTHAVFLNAVEFVQAALVFPIIFLPASSGNPQISPVALLGLVPNQNLFVDGKRWDAGYLPAFFRRMPYLTAPLPGSDQVGVYVDAQWPGLGDDEGEPLFTAEGEHAPALSAAIDFLKAFDEETRRTAQLCARLQQLGLFTEMKADFKVGDGRSMSVDGFMVVDEAKLGALADADIVALHRDGVLGLVHAHLLSLNHIGSLVDRLSRRSAAAPG